MKQLSI